MSYLHLSCPTIPGTIAWCAVFRRMRGPRWLAFQNCSRCSKDAMLADWGGLRANPLSAWWCLSGGRSPRNWSSCICCQSWAALRVRPRWCAESKTIRHARDCGLRFYHLLWNLVIAVSGCLCCSFAAGVVSFGPRCRIGPSPTRSWDPPGSAGYWFQNC